MTVRRKRECRDRTLVIRRSQKNRLSLVVQGEHIQSPIPAYLCAIGNEGNTIAIGVPGWCVVVESTANDSLGRSLNVGCREPDRRHRMRTLLVAPGQLC